jgi:hypothetical protein
VEQLTDCGYTRNNARFDSCACGAVADDAAMRMQNDERLFLVIDGFAWNDERTGVDLKRAENAWLYVTEARGIDPGRVVMRWVTADIKVTSRHRKGLQMWLVSDLDHLPLLEVPRTEQ